MIFLSHIVKIAKLQHSGSPRLGDMRALGESLINFCYLSYPSLSEQLIRFLLCFSGLQILTGLVAGPHLLTANRER